MELRHSRFSVAASIGIAQTLAWGSTYYLPAILARPIGAELGLGSGWVFGAFSAALIVSGLLGPAAGRRIDGRGGRDVLAASNLVFAAGLALLGLAQGPVLLGASWLVIGAGMGMGLYDAAFATLAGIYGREARGPITGVTLLAGLASTVSWPLTAWMDAEIGWRGACFAWAAAHVLIALPLNRLMVPPGTQAPAPSSDGRPRARPRLDRGIALLAFVFASTWFTSTAMAAHLPRLLQEAGASVTAAVAATALVGPAQVAAQMLEFGLLRRFSPLLSARLATLTHPLGALALVVLGAPAAAAFSVLHGAGNGILTIAKGTLPLVIYGAAGYGERQGILMIPARFGQAAAPLLFAFLIDEARLWALALSSALGLAAFLCLCALRVPKDGAA